MQETQELRILCLDGEEPLEEEMAIHSSILAWKNPMDRGVWGATVHGPDVPYVLTKRQTSSETNIQSAFCCILILVCSPEVRALGRH